MSKRSERRAAKAAKEQQDLLKQQQQREAADVENVITLRDLIAPASLEFKSTYFIMGTHYCRTLYAYGYPRAIYTGWLSSIINLDEVLDISMFIYPVDTQVVMNNLQRKVTQLEASMDVNAENGKVRDPALQAAYADAEELRDKLQVALGFTLPSRPIVKMN